MKYITFEECTSQSNDNNNLLNGIFII